MIGHLSATQPELSIAGGANCRLWLDAHGGGPAEHETNLCGVRRLSARGL